MATRRYPLGQKKRDAEAAVWARIIAELRAIREAMGLHEPQHAHAERSVYDDAFDELAAIRDGFGPRLDATAIVVTVGLSGHQIAVPAEHMVWTCGHRHWTRELAATCVRESYPMYRCGHRHMTRDEATACERASGAAAHAG